MTQDELELLLLNLLCCSVNLADKISTDLQIGNCDDSNNLILLTSYIQVLEFYSLEDSTLNCLSNDDIQIIINKATNICNLCDCN